MDNFGVRGSQQWRRLILPGIFPAYVTGGITAAGGALERLDRRRDRHVPRTHAGCDGLGAYIAQATRTGEFAKVLTGIVVMSIYVVGVNTMLWRRLYRLAETRYSL